MIMNKKGFTLVELLATIILLAIVLSLSSIAIIGIINSSKEKNYEQLISNIKDGAEVYYQECKYSKEAIIKMFKDDVSNANAFCDYNISLGELVTYGYIKGNSKDYKNENVDEKLKFILVNSYDELDISNCIVRVEYKNGKIVVTDESDGNTSCPTTSEYTSGKIDSNRKK